MMSDVRNIPSLPLVGLLKASFHCGRDCKPFIMEPSYPLVEEVMRRRTIHAFSVIILG
jgi:hypothetical protein